MEQTELQQVLDMAECGIFTTKQDTEMQLIYANARFYEILHYTPEEFEKKFDGKLLAAVLQEDKQKVRNLIARQSSLVWIACFLMFYTLYFFSCLTE